MDGPVGSELLKEIDFKNFNCPFIRPAEERKGPSNSRLILHNQLDEFDRRYLMDECKAFFKKNTKLRGLVARDSTATRIASDLNEISISFQQYSPNVPDIRYHYYF